MVRINGVWQMISPLHISAPGEARYDFETGLFSKSKDLVPCTTVRKEKVICIGDSAAALSEGEAARIFESVPVIPSNGQRGLLRRCITDLVAEALAKRGQTMSLDAYHTINNGSAIGTPDSAKPTLQEVKQAIYHPLFGLLGGTTKMVESALVVFNGYPVCPITLASGAVDERFSSYKAGTNRLTQVDMFKKDDDVEKSLPASAMMVLKDPEKEIGEWRDFLDGKVERADGADHTKAGLRTWASREVVLPGTCFQVGYGVRSYDHAMIGLLLLGIERLVTTKTLGGRSAIGYGRFRVLECDLTVDGKSHKLFGEDGRLDRNNAEIKGYIDEAQEFLAEMDVATIEEISKPKPKPKDSKDGEGKSTKNKKGA